MSSTTFDSTLVTTTSASTTSPSRARVIIGRVLSGLTITFLAWDAAMKIIEHPMVLKASEPLGLPLPIAQPVGLILAAVVALYAIPRTAVFGAVLLTGYLGGAILVHLRVGDPLFSHTLFPIYVALFAWGGLYLRDSRVGAL